MGTRSPGLSERIGEQGARSGLTVLAERSDTTVFDRGLGAEVSEGADG
jgi:hypothetical protein